MPSKILRFLLIAGLAAATCAWAEEEGATATVKLSAPGKPATLRVDLPWADIQILGVDGDTVTVESTLSQKGAKETRNDGLRRLDDNVSFELTEHENVVSLRLASDNPWANHGAEFKISVPRAMALDVKTDVGGDLVVRGIDGDVEVNNMNGEVRLEGLSGSTVVNTMNGRVLATYSKPLQKLVSITSMNGKVDLRVPTDTKANVRLSTQNGSILTDFDESVLKTKSEGKSGVYNNPYDGANVAKIVVDASRMAVQAGQEISQEISQELDRAVKDEMSADAADDSAPNSGAKPPRPPRAPRVPRFPIPAFNGGKVVSGTLNGGGVDIKISAMNGEITLRQTK